MDQTGLPAGFAALTTEYAMLPAGGHVLCAVSGGADSVCLLHLLKGQAEAEGFTLTAAHFDHGLRGEDSRRDAAFVAQLCRDWGVPCVTGSGDVAVEAGRRGAGLEETARDLRYAFLEEAADAVDADVIATAHNAGDNVETLLLHLIRGSGLQGLAGIPPRRGRLVRPLLATSRAEITAYLEAHGLPHVEDASNADPAFARNKLRHQVLPLLQALNPRLEEALGETIRRLRADNDYLNAQAAGMAREAAWADDDLVTRAQLVARAPDPIAVRIIRWMLLEMGEHQFSAAHLQAVVDLARSSAPSGRVDLAHGLTAYRVYGDLLLTVQGEDPLPPFTPVPLALEGETSLPEAGWALTCRRAVTPAEAPRGGNHFFLDPARLSGPLVLRPRQTGDRLALPGRGEKTVKKLLIDGKVPRRLRERVPVLADGAGVVWLGGFGPHRDRLAAPGVEALEVAAVRG